MSRFSCLIPVALALALYAGPVAAGDYEQGRQCWKNGDYAGACQALLRYRETPYGRNAQVDYMLGTSGCHIDSLHSWGSAVLEWMLQRYALPSNCRAIVTDAMNHCDPSSSPSLASVEKMMAAIGATARASGKMYYWIGHDNAFNNFVTVSKRTIDPSVLAARRFPRAEIQRAADSTRVRVKGFDVVTSGRFVFASKSGQANGDPVQMASLLGRYEDFLEREYAIRLPDVCVTVYLVRTPEDIRALALQLHGLDVGHATLAYSFRDDMSIVALGGAVGTLQHEFFHLTVRSTFGDIPQWLDEGLASLYEVSRMATDTTVEVTAGQTRPARFVGLPNWRGRVLSELQSERPPLEQMITSNWFAFEQPGNHDPDAPDARHMAVTLAAARYFTLYLQDRGMLKPLYERLHSQVPDPKRDARTAALAAVADVTHEPLDRLDHDFMEWFNSLPRQPQ